MDWKIALSSALALYASILATYTFYFDRAGRLKIIVDIMHNCVMSDHSLVDVYQFTIVNIGAKKRIIAGIGHEFNTMRGCTYGSFRQPVKNAPLEPGETLSYEIFATDFVLNHVEAQKFRLVVRDTTEKKYKTRWIKYQIRS